MTDCKNNSETPKTWGEMTDDEKGALLLAVHERKVIEDTDLGMWNQNQNPQWHPESGYRVKPEPKRETVTFNGYVNNGIFFRGLNSSDSDVRITFDTIDGEPDCSSVKMERIK